MLPAKLKFDSVLQLDYALQGLSINQNVGIYLLSYKNGGHIPTLALLDLLQQIEGASIVITHTPYSGDILNEDQVYIAISKNGDMYLLSESERQDKLLVSEYSEEGKLSSIELDKSELVKDLDIVGAVEISNTKTVNSAMGSLVIINENRVANTHYVESHFTRFSKTIFSIIGIAIVLALFNDFVAPYGHTRLILKDLRSLEWSHDMAFSLRRNMDGSIAKVNYWWHSKDKHNAKLQQHKSSLRIAKTAYS